MSTQETRTVSSTGGEKGVKDQRHDLLPRVALDRISEVYAFGARKYADHNWRRGYEWGKSYAAAQRHLTAFWDGESLDPESGLSHVAHAGFHLFALLTWLDEQGEGADNPFDDRWRAGMERARRESAAEEEARLLEEQDQKDHDYFMRLDAIRKDLENGLEPYTDEECQPGREIFTDDSWQTIGWVDETQVWTRDFPRVELDHWVDAIDEDVRAMAAYTVPVRFVAGLFGIEDLEADSMTVKYPNEILEDVYAPAFKKLEEDEEAMRDLFQQNRFVVRRHPAYDESYLLEGESAFVTDFSSEEFVPSRWDRG